MKALGGPPFRSGFDVLLQFLVAVYESRSVDELRAGYLSSVSLLIRADAYGFYFLDPSSKKPRWVATKGAQERFLERYEDAGRACDPLLEYLFRTQEPVHNNLLFSDREWKKQPLLEIMSVQGFSRTMQAPVVIGEQVVGTLDFARGSGRPSFTDKDIRRVRLIAHHTAKALERVLSEDEERKNRALAEAALESVGIPIVVSDCEGRIIFANYEAAQVAGLGADRSGGESFSEALRSHIVGLDSQRVATNSAQVGRSGPDGAVSTSMILRSAWLADKTGVLTILCPTNSGQDFEHLAHVLSRREREVLELLSQGLRNKQIADALQVSVNTVKHHLRRMFDKMQVDSRSHLLARAAGVGESSPAEHL